MGTRTIGIIDHCLPQNIRSTPPSLLPLLAPSIPACLAVEQYWREAGNCLDPASAWSIEEGYGDDLNGWCFRGPGGVRLNFWMQVAEISSSVRWRGLLTIPDLRQVQQAAFRAIARAVGATRILFAPDYADELIDVMSDGASFEDCLKLMNQTWGATQGTLDEISTEVIADCENCPPRVWYLEVLDEGSAGQVPRD